MPIRMSRCTVFITPGPQLEMGMVARVTDDVMPYSWASDFDQCLIVVPG